MRTTIILILLVILAIFVGSSSAKVVRHKIVRHITPTRRLGKTVQKNTVRVLRHSPKKIVKKTIHRRAPKFHKRLEETPVVRENLSENLKKQLKKELEELELIRLEIAHLEKHLKDTIEKQEVSSKETTPSTEVASKAVEASPSVPTKAEEAPQPPPEQAVQPPQKTQGVDSEPLPPQAQSQAQAQAPPQPPQIVPQTPQVQQSTKSESKTEKTEQSEDEEEEEERLEEAEELAEKEKQKKGITAQAPLSQAIQVPKNDDNSPSKPATETKRQDAAQNEEESEEEEEEEEEQRQETTPVKMTPTRFAKRSATQTIRQEEPVQTEDDEEEVEEEEEQQEIPVRMTPTKKYASAYRHPKKQMINSLTPKKKIIHRRRP